jgi:hypothetical protein
MSITLEQVTARISAARSQSMRGWLREPLLHFALIGALLFALDYGLASREDDPRVIVIGADVDAQAVAVFQEARGRAPNRDELFALRRVWLDNEVLYREGMALGLDRGDKAIRERVIFKALSVVDAGVKRPALDEATLRAWFEKHRSRYDEPARFDFEEAIVVGSRTEEIARRLAESLNAGAPGDLEADLRVFTGRPRGNVVQSYGEEFASGLEIAIPGEWRALPSKEGSRVIRLRSVTAAKPASFEDLGAIVYQDWTDEVMAAERSEAVGVLARKYTVKVSEPAR